jgi:hypothetical protein
MFEPLTMKHTGIILVSITQINGTNEVDLLHPMAVMPNLGNQYNYTFHIRYDLSLEYKLNNSLSLSVIPPINPEDSQYRKYAKWQTATAISDKIFLRLKSKKYNSTFKTIECLNFGGIWRENLIDSAFLDHDDVLVAKLEGKTVQGEDYITLTGNWVIEIAATPKDTFQSHPENFGVPITHEPTLVRPSNMLRARIHLMNTGDNTIWLSFGGADTCIVDECLKLPPLAYWNDERLDKAIIGSTIHARTEGDPLTLTSQITGVEVSWVS